MKTRWMFNKTFRAGVLLGIFALVSLVPVTAGAASWFATLQAETDVLDLETQTVAENDVLSPDDSDTADMRLGLQRGQIKPLRGVSEPGDRHPDRLCGRRGIRLCGSRYSRGPDLH
jgi:hypothetical protein